MLITNTVIRKYERYIAAGPTAHDKLVSLVVTNTNTETQKRKKDNPIIRTVDLRVDTKPSGTAVINFSNLTQFVQYVELLKEIEEQLLKEYAKEGLRVYENHT